MTRRPDNRSRSESRCGPRHSAPPEVDAEGRVVDLFFLDEPDRLAPLPNAAVLMAGGRGERLRPLTEDRPKPMLSIGGKPVLERAMDHLIDQGFRRFYLSINYLGHVSRNFRRWHPLGVESVPARDRSSAPPRDHGL